MTQNPEIEPGIPAPLNSAEVTDLAALDQGTYSSLRTARSEARLELDGSWHQISPRYVVSQIVQNLIFLAFVLAAAVVLALVLDQSWVWIPAAVVVAIEIITRDPPASSEGHRLHAARRRHRLPQGHPLAAHDRRPLRAHAARRHHPGSARPCVRRLPAQDGDRRRDDRRADPRADAGSVEALRDTLIEVAETRRTGL